MTDDKINQQPIATECPQNAADANQAEIPQPAKKRTRGAKSGQQSARKPAARIGTGGQHLLRERGSKPAYVPTPTEIAAGMAEAQSTWSDRERADREAWSRIDVSLSEVCVRPGGMVARNYVDANG